MSIADVSALVTEAARISKRGDLPLYAGMLLGFLEDALNAELRTGDMLTSTTLTTDSDGVVALPSDYLQVHAVTYGSDVHLRKITQAIADAGVEGYYVDGTNFVSSEASTAHTFHYYQSIPSLWTNSTNWLLTKKPELYLRGLVFEAFKDAQDVEGAASAKILFNAVLSDLKDGDVTARRADTVHMPRTQI